MPQRGVPSLTYGRGLNWSLSRAECHIFHEVAAYDGSCWNYGSSPAPKDCTKALREVLDLAAREGIPRFVLVTAGVALRLMTDPAFDLAGVLRSGSPTQHADYIEVALPISRRPLLLRIVAGHVQLSCFIVAQDKDRRSLAHI